ncbi:MAG: hypothetical protein WAL99_01420 [Pseudonocardiaceae bacterium]
MPNTRAAVLLTTDLGTAALEIRMRWILAQVVILADEMPNWQMPNCVPGC